MSLFKSLIKRACDQFYAFDLFVYYPIQIQIALKVVIIENKICHFTRETMLSGVNFINIIFTAFSPVDPESVKRHL